jgi:hypothetical protein
MPKTSYHSAALTLLVIVLTCCTCGSGSSEPGRYYADDLDFSIRFPAGWEVCLGEDGYLISAVSPLDGEDDMLFESISVGVEDMLVKVDLDEYFNAVNRASRSELAWFEIEETTDVQLANCPAKRAVFTYVDQGETVRTLGYCLVKGSKAYLITCISDEYSYPSYAAEFATTAESFRFE